MRRVSAKAVRLRAFIIERLKERSSWLAIGFVCTSVGLKFSADVNWEVATNIGILIASVIQFFWPDRPK